MTDLMTQLDIEKLEQSQNDEIVLKEFAFEDLEPRLEMAGCLVWCVSHGTHHYVDPCPAPIPAIDG